jgi:hypothetical protein
VFFECGDGSRITALTPPLVYKYAGGERDFSGDVELSMIKRFLNEEFAILSNTIGKNFSSMTNS